MKLSSEHILLRAVEPKDATLLLLWENNPDNWHVSGTEIPYSMHQIQQYIETAHNFRSTGQLRFIICLKKNEQAIGTVDLFDANFKHRRAGIGILIADTAERGKGYAKEALSILLDYCHTMLDLQQVYCHVELDNRESLSLFHTMQFEKAGILKSWNIKRNKRTDVVIYQRLLQ